MRADGIALVGTVAACLCAGDASAGLPSERHAAAEVTSLAYAYVTTPGRELLSANGGARQARTVTFSAAARNRSGGPVVARVPALRMRRAGRSAYRLESRKRRHAIAVDHRYVTATVRACNDSGCSRLIADFVDNTFKRQRFVRERA